MFSDRASLHNKGPPMRARAAADLCSTPWTIGACATFMGFAPSFIRRAIVRGVRSGTGTKRIRLDAEVITVAGRRRYRVHRDQFARFLKQIGWQRMPTAADAPIAAQRFSSTRSSLTNAA
jgi:hypothetical protein